MRGDSLSRRDIAASALMDAALQQPAADAHHPDMPAGNAALRALADSWIDLGKLDLGPDEWTRGLQRGLSACGKDLRGALVAEAPATGQSCPAGSPQTDHGASIVACAQQDRYPLLYALIHSGADVCAAIEAVLTERKA